jgi:hypothetical protein
LRAERGAGLHVGDRRLFTHLHGAGEETAELSIVDARKFRFMIDEVPNFAMYVMEVMARRIRGMSAAI